MGVPNQFIAKTVIESAKVNQNFAVACFSGEVRMYGGSVAPSGWLLCNGAEVARTTYADLFAVIGNNYGSGNGSTTFNLPNFKGRSGFGYDASQSEFNALGKTGGAKAVDLSHSHANRDHRHYGYANGGDLRAAIGAKTGVAGSINYQAVSPVNPVTGAGTGNGTYSVNAGYSTNNGYSHYTPVYGYTSFPGEWTAPEVKLSATQGIMNPYLVVNFIIKT
jgi:microcystin-dependent protein